MSSFPALPWVADWPHSGVLFLRHPNHSPSWMACAFITQRSRHPRLERFRDLGASGKGGPELRQSLLCPGCVASEQLFYQPLARNPAPDPGRAKGR